MYGYGFRNLSRSILAGGGGAIPSIWNGLQAYYTADNTPNDALGTYNGTLVNGATYGTGIINQGFSFDGVNDYVDLPDNTFDYLSDFSISGWFNTNSLSGDKSIYNVQNGSAEAVRIMTSGDKLTFRIINSFVSYSVNSITTLSINTWYHFVATFEQGVGKKLYINGVLDNSDSVTNVPSTASTLYKAIGAYKLPSTGHYFNGIIDEIAEFNGTLLTPTQVTELYNSGAGLQYPDTNPLWNGLSHYYNADNNITDLVGSSNMTLANGATYGTGIIGQSFAYDGVNDYSFLADDTFAPTGDFTISMWVNFTSFSGGWFCNIGDYSAGQGILFYVTGNKIVSIISNAGNDIIGNVVGNPTITTGTWHQVVLTYTATTVKYYIDGSLIVNRTPTKAPAYPSPCPNVFGASGSLTNNTNGIIDEVALFDGTVWTDAQVTEAYNSGLGKQYTN